MLLEAAATLEQLMKHTHKLSLIEKAELDDYIDQIQGIIKHISLELIYNKLNILL